MHRNHAHKRTVIDDIEEAIDNHNSKLNVGIDFFAICCGAVVLAMIAAEIFK